MIWDNILCLTTAAAMVLTTMHRTTSFTVVFMCMHLASVCGRLTESGEYLELKTGGAESATTDVISPTF